jgi:uncharacterized protein (TIGR03435 family)
MTAVLLLLKATVTLALALAGARLLRRNRAALRHVLLAAGFAGLLLLPIVSRFGPSVPLQVPVALPAEIEALEVAPAPSVTARGMAEPAATRGPQTFTISLSAVLIALWGVGGAVGLLPLAAGLWQVHRLRRTAPVWPEGTAMARALAADGAPRRPIEVLRHDAIASPMTCGLLRPAIVLPADAPAWSPEDLQRAIVHELEHVRRGDWFTQLAARAIGVCYWVHPLVWIAWRQLVLEAERACDDAVVRRSDAAAYADQLVLLAERLSASGQPQPAMAGRHDLATRVRAVLDTTQDRGRAGMRWVALSAAIAALLIFAISTLRVVAAFGQSTAVPPASQDAKDRFEVASIRPCPVDEAPPGPARGTAGGTNASFSPGRMNVPCVTIEQLVYLAYASYGAPEEMRLANDSLGGPSDAFKVRGGTDWVHSQRDKYAVEATAPGASDRTVLLGSMLRALLEERFKLKMRRGTEEVPMYALTVAKSGFKLKPMNDGDCVPLQPGEIGNGGLGLAGDKPRCGMLTSGARGPNALWRFNGFSIATLAGRLSRTVGRHVIDRTSITDTFIYTLEFHPDENTPGIIWGDRDADTSAPQAASIFTALEQQLGLKLESIKAPRGFLVIDHIERPASNGGGAVLRR